MDPVIKQSWIAALRSGEYQQTQKTLKDANGYCCLGVLCHIAKDTVENSGCTVQEKNDEILLTYDDEDGESHEEAGRLFKYLSADLGIGNNQMDLVNMNDGHNQSPKSFTEIADWIEQNL